MKKTFITLLLIMAAFENKTKAQPSVPDTLAYLQNIVANKAQFIGQPFSVLKDSLAIQIKFFNPKRGITYNITKETSTRIGFYFPQVASDLYLTYPSLEIFWQPYLSATQSDILYTQNNGGSWSTSVTSFYSSGIIADIKVRE